MILASFIRRQIMKDQYASLLEGLANVENVEPTSPVDSFFGRQSKIRLSSVDDLSHFIRIGADTLVHKSKKDLWKLTTDTQGKYVIERMFDDDVFKSGA